MLRPHEAVVTFASGIGFGAVEIGDPLIESFTDDLTGSLFLTIGSQHALATETDDGNLDTGLSETSRLHGEIIHVAVPF